MRLNTLKPARGSKTASRRVGRGLGSGLGITGGRGYKGQKSRSGGIGKVGFEGGQMPLQRRLPKFGFNSMVARFRAEIGLSELNAMSETEIDLAALKKNNLIRLDKKVVKVILRGEIKRAVTLKGLAVTAGAKKAIEAAGGKVE